MEIVFLTLDDVMTIHRNQIQRYGGRDGLRERGMLLSAIAMPEASFGGKYLHPDLPAMAAAYLYHIIQNHPFVDGNKRVGLVAALAFLYLNGHRLQCAVHNVEEIVWAVAQGHYTKEALIIFFREYTLPNSPESRESPSDGGQ